MSAPFVPENVARRFVQAVLTADAAVLAQLSHGAADIAPNVLPGERVERQLLHAHAGPRRRGVAMPMRAPIAQVAMWWEVTAWEPSFSQEALDDLMEAVMGVLIGSDTRGKTHFFIDGARRWSIDVDVAPDDFTQLVPLDLTGPGVWAPIRHRYAIALRPVD